MMWMACTALTSDACMVCSAPYMDDMGVKSGNIAAN